MKRLPRFLSLFLFSFLSLSADYHVLYDLAMAGGEQSFYRHGNIIKQEGPSFAFIMDFDRERITIESKMLRSTWSGSFAAFSKGMKEARESLGMLARHDSLLPLSAGSGADSISSRVAIQATEVQDTVAGFRCTEYRVSLDGRPVEYFFHTEELSPYSGLDYDKIARVSALAEHVPAYRKTEAYRRYMVKGLITRVLVVPGADMPADPASELIEVSHKTLDPSVFGPTTQFKPLPIKELLMAVLTTDGEGNVKTK